ncbi:MAG: cytochrome P450 [Leptolyngbyaceae bacterium]|nr:cytochrome P450 [Leptolyngbyaceae bacterium]
MQTPPPISSLPLPPGQTGLPVLGETLDFFRDPKFAQKRHEQYGDVFRTQLLGKPTVFLRGPEANRFVLSRENEYFVVSWPPSTKALLGPLSLALQTGAAHQGRRKLLSQAFLPRSLSGYIPAMLEITHTYLKRWADLGELTWYPELRNYTLDIACKLFVGLDQGSQTQLGHLFETWCQGLFSLPLSLPWTTFGRAQHSRKLLLEELERIIRDRQQQSDLTEDALGLLIQARDEEGQGLSLEELKDQVLLLLFAGHETLTSAITSFCLVTAQNPEVTAALRVEQQQMATAEPLTLEQLRQMTYLDQVLQEVLRLIPPVGGGFRKVLQTCEFGGYQIPQGWRALYQIGPTHQDPAWYPQPERFDPTRFASEPSSDRPKYAYVPFGGGIRECIGKEFARLEMKLFATSLLRNYQWQLLPDQNLEFLTIPVPRPRDGLRVKFCPISASQI